MTQRSPRYDLEVTRKLEDLREKAGVSLTQAAKHFGRRKCETVRDWETGISKCPKIDRADFITYLLNILGLGRDEQGIIEFLLLWDELMVMQWEWQALNLEELELYLPGKIDIVSRLIESLTL